MIMAGNDPLIQVDLEDGRVKCLRVWPSAGTLILNALAVVVLAALVGAGAVAWSDVVTAVRTVLRL